MVRPGRAAAVVLVGVALAAASCGGHTGRSTSSSKPPTSRSISATTGPGTTAPGGTSGSDWVTYHGDDQRRGVDMSPVSLAHAHVAWTSPPLDGQVYAEPLVWKGLVIVATENDTLYGLSAHDGAVVWSAHVGTPVPLSDLPCGDVNPLGILGTPVIDPVTGYLFAVTETLTARGTIGHELVAVDPTTGQVVYSESDAPSGMNSPDQQQRAALLVTDGRVYAAYGGLFGDCGTYAGWVVGAPTTGPGPLVSYRVDTPNQAAIWAPPGIVVDNSGDLLVATGNGESTTTYDYGDSVVKLAPSLGVLDSFAPTQWAYYNGNDLDLGSTAPVLVDGGRYVFIIGKQTVGYLLDESHLGGIGGQVYQAGVCFAIGGDAAEGDDVYVPCSSGVKDVRVDPASSPASFRVVWSTSGATNAPILAGGLLWSVGGATLYGLDPATGAVEQQLDLGQTPDHFVTPAVGDGLLLIGAGDTVRAFAGSG